MTARAFCRIDHLEIDSHASRHGCEVAVALHLRLGICQPDSTVAVVIPDRVVRIVPQFLVEFDGVAFQPDHGLVHAEIRDLRGGVPGRATGQLVSFDQNHIAPAFLGQMIEGRASGDAASYHDGFGSAFHGDPSFAISGFTLTGVGSFEQRSYATDFIADTKAPKVEQTPRST